MTAPRCVRPWPRLMKPRSIAIVGVSARARLAGGNVVGISNGGFTGVVHLVSRTRSEVFRPALPADGGRSCPKASMCRPLHSGSARWSRRSEACARQRAGNVLIFAAGFAETGARGSRRSGASRKSRAAGMGIIGPNCLGVTNSLPGGRAADVRLGGGEK